MELWRRGRLRRLLHLLLLEGMKRFSCVRVSIYVAWPQMQATNVPACPVDMTLILCPSVFGVLFMLNPCPP